MEYCREEHRGMMDTRERSCSAIWRRGLQMLRSQHIGGDRPMKGPKVERCHCWHSSLQMWRSFSALDIGVGACGCGYISSDLEG